LGPDQPHWWESVVASFVIGFGSVSLVSVTVEAGTNALFVCYAEDPSPLAAISTPLYSLFIAHPHVSQGDKGINGILIASPDVEGGVHGDYTHYDGSGGSGGPGASDAGGGYPGIVVAPAVSCFREPGSAAPSSVTQPIEPTPAADPMASALGIASSDKS